MNRIFGYFLPVTLLIAVWWSVVILFDIPHFILPAPDRVAAVLFDRFTLIRCSRDHNCARNYLWSNFGFHFRVHRRLSDRRLQTTSVNYNAGVNHQSSSAGIRDRPNSYAMARLWIRIQTRYDYFDRLFSSDSQYTSGFRALPASWDATFQTLRPRRVRLFLHVRLPLAIPYTLSGVRVAASIAYIGAVVGEWVGSSSGLGYLMLHANARGQTDLMFAALVVLCAEALTIWSVSNRISLRFDHKYTANM